MNKIALYIHIPFCIKKCLYCDFHSFRFDISLFTQYKLALLKEIGLYSNRDFTIETVYIGGGTPSVFPLEYISEIVKAIPSLGKISDNLEFTIEVNPGTIDREKLEVYKSLGINRISIGIQSLIDEELKTLGRIHTKEEALYSIQLAKEVGFNNINVDLIYGIPGQNLESWGYTLRKVLDLDITHVSIYGLMYEPGTPLYKFLIRKRISPMSEDLELEIFNLTQEVLKEYDFSWYEISNYAKKGYECRHNMTYWEGGDYLGLGSSAHSLIEGTRYSNTPNIESYVKLLSSGKSPRVWIERLPPLERAKELIILGLRMKRGVSLREVYQRTRIDVSHLFNDNIKKLVDEGLISFKDERIALTERGRLLGNLVFEEFY